MELDRLNVIAQLDTRESCAMQKLMNAIGKYRFKLIHVYLND